MTGIKLDSPDAALKLKTPADPSGPKIGLFTLMKVFLAHVLTYSLRDENDRWHQLCLTELLPRGNCVRRDAKRLEHVNLPPHIFQNLAEAPVHAWSGLTIKNKTRLLILYVSQFL